ncbi:MAG: SRPBCC family protein [Paludibacteraceae bacterium]|nr:SRPBCC family protein [Paludibacteraceae bacterium]
MAETKIESAIERIPYDVHTVFCVLSHLKILEKIKEQLPAEQTQKMEEKIQELEFGEDFIRVKVDGLGQKICMRIVEQEENKTLKFGFENLPLDMNFWIQFKEVAPQQTAIKLTLKVDMPFMFKMMLPDKKLQEGTDQAAKMLAQLPYANLLQWV